MLPLPSLMVTAPLSASSTKLPGAEPRLPVALIATPGAPVKDVGGNTLLGLVKSAWRDAKLTEATPDCVEALCRNVPGVAGIPDIAGVPELKETPCWFALVPLLARAVDADVENAAVPKFEGGGRFAVN